MTDQETSPDTTVKQRRMPKLIFLWIALGMWVIVYIMQWEFGGLITLVLIRPLQWLVLICSAIVSLVWLVQTIVFIIHNKMRRKYILRICVGLVLIGAIIISLFYPLDDYYEETRFALLCKRFDQAAVLALKERHLDGFYKLPYGYRCLSRDSRGVEIFGGGETKVVFFFTFVGILDHFSGYAYVPNSSAYQVLLENGDWVQIIPERENWYFCASM